MKSIFNIALLVLFISFKSVAQSSINDYKYVVVPNAFTFLNEPDQYKINSLTKFLFEKYGFNTLMADADFPEDLNNNRCLALYADVEKHKAFLNTKLQVHLKDCNNKVIWSSDIGQSREKEYDKVYNLALRDAFNSLENVDYKYTPSAKILSRRESQQMTQNVEATSQSEIDRLKKEVEVLREQQLRKEESEKQALIEQEKKLRKEAAETSKPEIKKEAKIELAETLKKETKTDESFPQLFANPVENGYNISDAASKLLYRLVFSGKEDVFIVKGQDAIVYKMNNTWILSTANDNGVSIKTLNVKFN